MKRITTLLMAFAIVALTAFTSTAQLSYKSMTRFNKATAAVTDTVTNGGTAEIYTGLISNSCNTMDVQITVEKISGTVAGSIVIEMSNDSTNWDAVWVSGVGADTTFSFTATNVASQNNMWKVLNPTARYFRAKYTGSGTMVAVLRGNVIGRRLF